MSRNNSKLDLNETRVSDVNLYLHTSGFHISYLYKPVKYLVTATHFRQKWECKPNLYLICTEQTSQIVEINLESNSNHDTVTNLTPKQYHKLSDNL